MILSFGYIKDVLACIGFLLCFSVVYLSNNIQFLRPWILLALLFAFLIDGIFSLYPSLHNLSIYELK